jgi:HAE1 family hydrophobic/amphiphilic exporter-1
VSDKRDAPSVRERAPSLSAVAVRRPVAALMFLLIVCTVGLVSSGRLAVDLLPEFELPSVTVFAPYPGVGSLEVESLVLEPLEEAVAAVPGLLTLSSTAREGAAVIRMRFAHGHNLLEALGDVRVAVERTRNRLPDDLEAPQVFRFDPNSFPILYLSVTSGGDLREVTRIARDEIKPRLARVPGVAAVEIRGGFDREVRIELLASKLLDLGIPIEQVERALRAENIDLSVGKVRDAGREVGVRTVAAKRRAVDLETVPVATRDGRVVRLNEVSRIVDDTAEIDNVVRINGRIGVRLGVRKGPGENTIEVAHAVYRAIEKIEADFPEVEVGVIMDQSRYVENAVAGARNAALIGGILAIAVLLLFLRSFRATLLVAIAIPSSVLAAFIVMDRAGISLNLMSLGGIALGVGMLVDNAVVVLESVVHHLQRGRTGKDAAIVGAREVALAVAASTATTIVIFIPVLFLEGVQRVVYGQLALVVASALVASLLVSLTIVPAFAGRLFAKGGLPADSGFLLSRVERLYARLIDKLLDRPLSTLAVLVAIALAAGALIPRVKTELMPPTDEGQVVVNVELGTGTPLEETDALARRVSDIVSEVVPEAERVFLSVGSPGWWSSRTSEAARISVALPPLQERPRPTQDVAEAIRKAMPKAPGATIGVRTGGGMFLLRFLRSGSGEDRLEVKIRGEDLESMGRFATDVSAALKEVEGVVDVREPRLRGRDEIAVRVDPERAGSLGLSAQALGISLETYVRGRRVTRLRTAEEEVPVVMRLAEEDRQRVEQVEKLLVLAPATGQPVSVGEVASFSLEKGPVRISREEGARILQVGAEIEGRPLGEIVTDVRAKLQALPAPAGVRAIVSGEAAESDDMFRSLRFGALLALLLVFMVMAAQFESLVQPLIVMGAVPFAGVGVLILFGLDLSTLNIYSFMGMIVLVGIAVNNAIVLVDYMRQLREEEGMTVARAVRLACARRLRPILMTTATTMLGLLPVALSQAAGAELQGPLARVVVSGLLTGTLVTLVLVPVLYVLVEGWREKLAKR